LFIDIIIIKVLFNRVNFLISTFIQFLCLVYFSNQLLYPIFLHYRSFIIGCLVDILGFLFLLVTDHYFLFHFLIYREFMLPFTEILKIVVI